MSLSHDLFRNLRRNVQAGRLTVIGRLSTRLVGSSRNQVERVYDSRVGGSPVGRNAKGGKTVAHPTAKSRAGKGGKPSGGMYDLEAVIEQVRILWDAVAKVEPSHRSTLYGKIVDGIERLRKQVQAQLPESPSKPATYPLLRGLEAPNGQGLGPNALPHRLGRFPEPILRLYDKDLADQALVVLPQASRYSDLDAFREHLAGSLPFNAESTRHRAANYL